MAIPLPGYVIARAPGWSFEPGLYELLMLVGGAVVLLGAVILSISAEGHSLRR